MSTKRAGLFAAVILLFAVGAWPIGLALLFFAIFTPEKDGKTDKERIAELEKEIKDLNQKLDDQFIEKIIQNSDGIKRD